MKTEQVECIVCKKYYPRRLKGKAGRGARSKANERGSNTINCSPKCSRIYTRVRKRAGEYYINKIRTLKRKIQEGGRK